MEPVFRIINRGYQIRSFLSILFSNVCKFTEMEIWVESYTCSKRVTDKHSKSHTIEIRISSAVDLPVNGLMSITNSLTTNHQLHLTIAKHDFQARSC